MKEVAGVALAVEQTMRIAASRERVFELLTDAAQMGRWMPVTMFEPRIGGRVEFAPTAVAVGEVVAFEPPRLVAYTWDWRDRPLGARTEVRFELEEDGEGTTVRLTHTGFRAQERREAHRRGWAHYGQRLKTVAEGGDPGPDRSGARPDDAMRSRAVQFDDVFESVSRRLLDAHPGDERGRMLHSAGLKTAGTFYAFTTKGALVVKLPAARVDELIANGAGQPCAPAKGRPMREWVRLTPADEGACAAYVLEARTFVAAHTTP